LSFVLRHIGAKASLLIAMTKIVGVRLISGKLGGVLTPSLIAERFS
jgi:hypothetical protein